MALERQSRRDRDITNRRRSQLHIYQLFYKSNSQFWHAYKYQLFG